MKRIHRRLHRWFWLVASPVLAIFLFLAASPDAPLPEQSSRALMKIAELP